MGMGQIIMRKKSQKYPTLGLAVGVMLLLGETDLGAVQIDSGKEEPAIQFYGQINRAVVFADDGKVQSYFHADSTNSSTRIGVSTQAATTDQFRTGA